MHCMFIVHTTTLYSQLLKRQSSVEIDYDLLKQLEEEEAEEERKRV